MPAADRLRSVRDRWESILRRTGAGVLGAGELYDRSFQLHVSQRTAVLVDRAVARTCFARPYLLREALLRGFDPAVAELRSAVATLRRERMPLASYHVLNPRRRRPRRPSFDPYALLADTVWTEIPQPVHLRVNLTVSQRRAVDRVAFVLSVPYLLVVRHALALGWSATVSEIELLLAGGYRPAYLFRCLTAPGRPSASPWSGPRRQPLFGTVWMRRPGVDLSHIDPTLTEPDPLDPFLEELA